MELVFVFGIVGNTILMWTQLHKDALSGSSDLLTQSPNEMQVIVVRHASNSQHFLSRLLLKIIRTLAIEENFNSSESDAFGVLTLNYYCTLRMN